MTFTSLVLPLGVTEGPESVDFETGLLPPQEEHRLSKQDISSPTATVGALFTEGGEEINLAEEEPDIESRVSYHKFIIFSIKTFFPLDIHCGPFSLVPACSSPYLSQMRTWLHKPKTQNIEGN